MDWNDVARHILASVDSLQEDLVELAVRIVNKPSPPGYEREAGESLADWFAEHGIDTYVQDVEPTRVNAVGKLKGIGGAKSVTFNGHLDTTFTGRVEEDLPILGRPEYVSRPEAVVKDGAIHGLGIFNMKGPLVSSCIAALALKRSEIRLKGDMVVAGVAGEIGRGQVAPYKGPGTRGKGIGTYHLLHHGEWTDYAVVCEPSEWTISWAQPGCAYIRITTYGSPIYAPINERSAASIRENKNAIVKMAHLVVALEEWANHYEASNRYETSCGIMEPRVTVSAVDGGLPYKPNWRPGVSNVYLDVCIPPNRTPLDVRREVEDIVERSGLGDVVTLYMARRGYVSQGVEPIVEALTDAHLKVFDQVPRQPSWKELSVWTDVNIYAEHGIPVVKYGPAWPRDAYFQERMPIEDLMRAARVYALSAAKICSWQP